STAYAAERGCREVGVRMRRSLLAPNATPQKGTRGMPKLTRRCRNTAAQAEQGRSALVGRGGNQVPAQETSLVSGLACVEGSDPWAQPWPARHPGTGRGVGGAGPSARRWADPSGSVGAGARPADGAARPAVEPSGELAGEAAHPGPGS